MNKLSKIFLAIIIVLTIGLGVMTYLYIDVKSLTKTTVEENNEIAKTNEENKKSQNTDQTNISTNSNQTADLPLVSLSDVMSKSEVDALKVKIEQDEADYGDNYQEFDHFSNVYKRKPDRIYFKSPDANGFYLFDKNDKDYEHLLEVSEDRMFYSTIEDYNLYCFTPDSIDTMMKSGDTYIIFDYDNGDLSELDIDYQKNLIFRFPQSTRLYRLATYLSYFKEMIPRNELGKSEFANNTKISGYKYIFSDQYLD